MLLIGLKEQPRLFIPLEVPEGCDEEPVGVRYSLGWTVMGPAGANDKRNARTIKETRDCLANVAQANNVNNYEMTNEFCLDKNFLYSVTRDDTEIEECTREQVGDDSCIFAHERTANEDNLLTQQLERLWNTDFNEVQQTCEYRMVKHVFGATSSPSCANFCLQKTASIYGGKYDEEVSKAVKRNMYVDDLMKSVNNTERAIVIAPQLQELLQRGGFKLTKWLSNDREVLMTIPESERARSVVNLDIDELPTETALRLKWNVEEDAFIWEDDDTTLVQTQRKASTRCGILSVVSSLFDPLGMIAPFIMKAKLLLQELCRNKLEWDEEIEELEGNQWLRWLSDLLKLKKVKVEGCFRLW